MKNTLLLCVALFVLGGCASLDGGVGTVPPASASRVAGLRFVCVGSWPDDHFLKHSFVELPEYAQDAASLSRLCSIMGRRASAFAGDGFVRVFVSGRDVSRLSSLTFQPEQREFISVCTGARPNEESDAGIRRLWFFPLREGTRLSQIPKQLCDALTRGSFLETAPRLHAWDLNLYGTEAERVALCREGAEVIDPAECRTGQVEDGGAGE